MVLVRLAELAGVSPAGTLALGLGDFAPVQAAVSVLTSARNLAPREAVLVSFAGVTAVTFPWVDAFFGELTGGWDELDSASGRPARTSPPLSGRQLVAGLPDGLLMSAVDVDDADIVESLDIALRAQGRAVRVGWPANPMAPIPAQAALLGADDPRMLRLLEVVVTLGRPVLLEEAAQSLHLDFSVIARLSARLHYARALVERPRRDGRRVLHAELVDFGERLGG